MKEFWNERYATETYVYGAEPNEYLKAFIDNHAPGKILLPGEGEGRNAVYAAKNSWSVDAIDQSKVGKNKALKLAGLNDVKINYEIGDIGAIDYYYPGKYDAIGLFFLHLLSTERKAFHSNMINKLNKNGYIILMGFSIKQIEYGTGGPPNIDMLFSLEDLKNDFDGLKLFEGVEEEIHLNEGIYHDGLAHVVRCIFTTF